MYKLAKYIEDIFERARKGEQQSRKAKIRRKTEVTH
jgi:hypothetical protein